MKFKQILLVPVLATAFAASASAQTSAKQAEEIPDAPQATAAALTRPNGPTVVMDTSMGRITCQFFQRQAPQAVANFIALAEGTKDWTDPVTNKKHHNKPLYNGTIFHRVMPEFMIQGGDPSGTGMGDVGYRFEDEFDPDLNFDVPGRLAMANIGPNTNSSQFFITEVPTEHLNHVHTIFGQCDESSILVVKTIARVQVDRNDKPVTPVVLKKVTIVPEGQPLPVAPNTAPVKRINVSAGVVQAMLLKKTPLTYPQEAKNARVSGTVALRAVISTKGRIESLNIISGPEALKGAALNTVKDWEYKPYLLNGEPVEVETTINVIFALSE